MKEPNFETIAVSYTWEDRNDTIDANVFLTLSLDLWHFYFIFVRDDLNLNFH